MKQSQEANELKKWLEYATKRDNKPIVYTILRHVSRSGMTRYIDLVCFDQKTGDTFKVGVTAARVLGYNYNPDKLGVRVTGAGMDMGFHLVNNLSYALYGTKQGMQLAQEWL